MKARYKTIVDSYAQAIHRGQLPAGTRLRLRFCEYNAQAQLELLIDKGEFDQLQPLAHPAAERWLYSLQPVSEGER